MYHVLSRTDVPAESRDEYIAIIREHASESLQEERGTLTFDVIQDEENPNRFYVSEAYTDEAAFQAHMQGPVAQRNFPRLLPLIGDNFAFLGKGSTIGPVES
jgi:(4S)-4-hydroxy-5-phosphonooxypentane-2,3-dione isomerase